MKVFRITTDNDHYCFLLPEDEAGFGAFAELDGTPRSDVWSPPRVRLAHPELKAGNFYSFGGGFLVADAKATDALYTLFEMAGEMLSLPYGDEIYTVLNVTQCFDCLDHKKTVWALSAEGRPSSIARYEFKNLEESPIFKIPEEDKSSLFVHEGEMEAGEEFRQIVLREGLEGLLLHEVWSSDDDEEVDIPHSWRPHS